MIITYSTVPSNKGPGTRSVYPRPASNHTSRHGWNDLSMYTSYQPTLGHGCDTQQVCYTITVIGFLICLCSRPSQALRQRQDTLTSLALQLTKTLPKQPLLFVQVYSHWLCCCMRRNPQVTAHGVHKDCKMPTGNVACLSVNNARVQQANSRNTLLMLVLGTHAMLMTEPKHMQHALTRSLSSRSEQVCLASSDLLHTHLALPGRHCYHYYYFSYYCSYHCHYHNHYRYSLLLWLV